MAVRTGIGAQLGLATESTYGTFVTPTRFLPFTSESIELSREFIESKGLRAGRIAQAGDLVKPTTRTAAGNVEGEFLYNGMGVWLNQLHGNTVTPSTVGTLGRRQIHEIGEVDPGGKSLTVQFGRPDSGGTVRPFSALGTKVAEATFSLDVGGFLNASFSVDSQDVVTSQSLATATYNANVEPFDFTQASIEFDDVAYTECVQSLSITVSNPHKTDRYCIGGGALKKEPVQNDLTMVTVSLEMEFASLTQWTAFTSDTRRKLEVIFTGDAIESGTNYGLTFTMPETVTRTANAPVQGPDMLTQTIELQAVDNGTDPVLTIDYLTTDTTV